MSVLGLSFLTPIALFGLLLLPLLYWLLRVRPPQPSSVVFPPFALLKRLKNQEQEARTSPVWLMLLRLILFTLLVLVTAQPFVGQKQTFMNGTVPLIVLDDTWAAANTWDKRLETAKLLLEDAARQNLPVRMMTTASARLDPAISLNPNQALERLSGLKPVAQARTVSQSQTRLANATLQIEQVKVFWLSDGLQDVLPKDAPATQTQNSAQEFAAVLSTLSKAPVSIFTPKQDELPTVIASVVARSGALDLRLVNLSGPKTFNIDLKNDAGALLLSSEVMSPSDTSTHTLTLPADLLTQVASLELRGQRHAGAKWLMAGTDKRFSVAVISGSGEKSQPLLTPSHYLTSAFSADMDLIALESKDIETAVLEALSRGAESLLLNGTGPLPDNTVEPLKQFVDKGGVLIRFADKALANADDGLLPAPPHANLRLFGGQLSWGSLPTIDGFAQNAPLQDVRVDNAIEFRAQLLLQPPAQGRLEVLASLSDGTPLVSLRRQGEGAFVFVHVDADPVWSNMMSSPSFAQIVPALARLSSFKADAAELSAGLRAPFRLMDGFGNLQTVTDSSLAVDFSKAPPFNAVPGLYGNEGATALNLMQVHSAFTQQRFSQDATRITQRGYPSQTGRNLMPVLLLLASLLFLADCLASLLLSGRLNWLKAKGATPLILAVLFATFAVLFTSPSSQAQEEPWQASLSPRLGYILTGDAQVDEVARAGMEGLSSILSGRTSLELSEPVGLRLDDDELGYFPFVYWAVAEGQVTLSDQERRNLNRFLSSGGTILIDTRDESALFGTNDFNSGQLRALLDGVSVPALAPVADNHVLTRSFYLIESFPGRFGDSTLWAESIIDDQDRLTRTGDGVSSVLLTNGDLAGAWALDAFGRPLLPVTPNGELQREYAFRAGVNMVLYAFTGNYKADQVHIPVIMERLGQ